MSKTPIEDMVKRTSDLINTQEVKPDEWLAAYDAPFIEEDPGYCGIGKYETGPKDPFWWRLCRPHDKKFIKLLETKISSGEWVTHRDFFKTSLLMGISSTAKLIYSPTWDDLRIATTWPFYFVFGGIGGMVRWRQLVNRLRSKEELEANPEINSPIRGQGQDG